MIFDSLGIKTKALISVPAKLDCAQIRLGWEKNNFIRRRGRGKFETDLLKVFAFDIPFLLMLTVKGS